MGRAERRRAERANRIDEKKRKILLTPEEIGRLKREITHSVSSFSVESLFTCFALAEHRLYGFDSEKISQSLRYIDHLMEEIDNDTACMEDYVRELEEETGIIVRCED